MEWILYFLIGLILGGFAGYYFFRWNAKKYFQENPPISKQQIRTMYQQMGRKPSEKQLNQIMKSMKSKNNSKTKK